MTFWVFAYMELSLNLIFGGSLDLAQVSGDLDLFPGLVVVICTPQTLGQKQDHSASPL